MMNSLKSACSFAKSTPVPLYQFQQHLEAVFRRKFSIELIIGLIRIFETTEHLNNAVHGNTLTCGWRSFAHTGSDEENVRREQAIRMSHSALHFEGRPST